MRAECHLIVTSLSDNLTNSRSQHHRTIWFVSAVIGDACGDAATLIERMRHRMIQVLGKKAKNPPCPPIYRDELCPGRFRLLTEVSVQAFAKLQPNSPEACLDRGLTQVQHFCRLIRRKAFDISQHEDRPQGRRQPDRLFDHHAGKRDRHLASHRPWL